MKRCKDCVRDGIETTRKVPHPGPRCATHHRKRRSESRADAWERRILATYDITAYEYEAILYHQRGVCFICERARGTSKKLSVDHDHITGYVRGLLCSTCNKMLGHLRDRPYSFERAVVYLTCPPAFKVIGTRAVSQ